MSGTVRESARREMPEALRREVRLLGDRLGRVVAASGGADLLEDVERLRRVAIAGRAEAAAEQDAEALVEGWSLERAEQVARAFTCYFHLVNLAEERHRARALREQDRESAAPRESLAATVAELRASAGDDQLRSWLDGLRVQAVFTAHPTEARRRAVVGGIRRVSDQLDRLEDPGAGERERFEADRRLAEEIDTLWRTAQLRSSELGPIDEVRTLMAVFDESLFRMVPALYRGLDNALGPDDAGRRPPLAPAFLRFGTWVGGDRDGNPFVTAAVSMEALVVQAEHVLLGLEAAAGRIGRALTADQGSTPPDPDLDRRLAEARAADPARLGAIAARSPAEPHRQFLLHVADRIRAVRLGDAAAYDSAAALLDDIRAVQRSLAAAGATRLAYGELQHLAWQVETFGFHLAELEVRQHSEVHERALAEVREGSASPEAEEVLATLRAVAAIQERFGLGACHRYVVSFTRGAADVAAVYELARLAVGGEGRPPVLDVIPLFETAADLEHSVEVLDDMLRLEAVRARVEARGGELEVMLGYSDSTKEVGPASATLALYDAQARLAQWATQRRVRLTIFHGRGGALGRGGGPANRAILAQAPGSVAGRFKVTEQGEVIFARYANPAIARRHLEQVSSAVLLSSTPAIEARTAEAADHFAPLAARVGAAARATYRGLVEAEGFEEWFGLVSPIDELGRLRLGSRPARRGGSRSLAALRAIPWVFAWSQMRLNLPGWYGLGSGLAAADLADLREAYARWPLFNVMLDNAEMSLAKADRRISSRYLALGGRDDLSERVLGEYDLTVERVLAVTGNARLLGGRRVLSWAVELRNPYVDALSHLQLRALRGLRDGGADSERLERLLLLTVNGVAAGLQNTG